MQVQYQEEREDTAAIDSSERCILHGKYRSSIGWQRGTAAALMPNAGDSVRREPPMQILVRSRRTAASISVLRSHEARGTIRICTSASEPEMMDSVARQAGEDVKAIRSGSMLFRVGRNLELDECR